MDEIIILEEEQQEEELKLYAEGEEEIDILEEGTELEVPLEEEGDVVNFDYNPLIHHPSINDVELIDDKSFGQLGVHKMTNIEIKAVFDRVFGGRMNHA